MTLTAEQRTEIRAARDRAVREGWDAHSRRASLLDAEDLLAAFADGEWLTSAEVAERLGVRRQEVRFVTRRLMGLLEVECEGGQGTTPRRFRRKLPPAG